jgi:hypothetical protein
MQIAPGDFLNADFAKFFLPLAGAVFAWFVNRQKERQAEDYRRKEERYRELLLTLRGFHDKSIPDQEAARRKFLDQRPAFWKRSRSWAM